jgi:phosphoribosyl-AMP cyclohydrolase / phosphoribosyl-ATP pyrophosphohydrolase
VNEDLIPAIVQDVDTRRVLMLAWMNPEARRLTEETGLVHFWSRSRQKLWQKGEESGNVLALVEIRSDCDDDALLVLARPAGPTCHTGSDTCWDEPVDAGFARLERLWSVIDQRATDRPEASYTTTLFEKGPDLPARKSVEEATEVLMAAKDHAIGTADDHRLAEEMADLVYHLLVLIRERGLEPSDVLDVLSSREGSTPR